MKKKECPSCAMEIDEKAEVCQICGYEFPKSKNYLVWIAILLVIFFLLMVLF